MLAPRTSGAFVCLQCRLRTSALQSTRQILQRGSAARFSSSLIRSHDDDGLLDRQVQNPVTRNSFRNSIYRLRRKIKKTRNGNVYSEQFAPLDIASLGTPSEIIVLRDANRGYPGQRLGIAGDRRQEEAQQDEPEEGPEHEGIFAIWEKETAAPEQGAVNAHIESLRPQPTPGLIDPNDVVYLTNKDFKSLFKKLYDGFTSPQLSRYFADSTGIFTSGDKDSVIQGLIKGSGGKKPTHQTEWVPGISNIQTRIAGGSAAMLSRVSRQKGGSKRLLVDQILRKAWHITLLEEIEAPGELEISLKQWQLSLLFAGVTPTPLDLIGENRKAKIEIYWPHNVLRITADKSSAEYAAQDVEKILKTTERFQFKLERWRPFLSPKLQAPQNLTELYKIEDLKMVERLAGVVIQIANKSEFIIRGIDKSHIADAHRSLLAMLQLDDHTSRIGVTKTIPASEKKHSTFVESSSKSALDYQYRSLDLGRWTLPVSRSETTKETGKKYQEATWVSSDNTLRDQILKSLERPTPFTPLCQQLPIDSDPSGMKELGWSTQPEMQTVAKFGQILHPSRARRPLISMLDTEGRDTSKFLAVFSNTIPGLSHLLTSYMVAANDLNGENSLEYHFIPSPERANVLSEKKVYPRLNLRVTLQRDGEIRLKGVRLDLFQDFTDVYLPDQATDIRFERRFSAYLYKAELDEQVSAYVKAISDNIKSGGRLSAPPSLQLKIPTWTILGPKATPSEIFHNGPKETKSLEYLFAGMQHRQSVITPFGLPPGKIQLPFGSHSLAYTGIEAGQLAGKYGELALKYSRKNKQLKPSEVLARGVLAHFVKTTFKVADRITNGSLNQYPFEKFLPRGSGTESLIAHKKVIGQFTEGTS